MGGNQGLLGSRTRGMRFLAIFVVIATMAVGVVALQQPQKAVAASSTGFDPGYIISDDLFYDRAAMSEAGIQAFLSAKIGTCQNALCLNVLTQDTYDRPKDRTVCNAYVGATNEPVSRMIYKVQQACGVSAKVLLVTLQKEMGLVTKTNPSQWSLDHAMGYACPDTEPCDSSKAGFYNQVYLAAWQFKRYSTPTPWGSYQPGWNNIRYNPNSSCGSSAVYIQNNATAALYNYTPYQPNAASLASYPGTGDACSSYGNRNFWFYFSDWFGPPNGADQNVGAGDFLGGQDFDGDGKVDLYARDSTGRMWFYPGDGNGGRLGRR